MLSDTIFYSSLIFLSYLMYCSVEFYSTVKLLDLASEELPIDLKLLVIMTVTVIIAVLTAQLDLKTLEIKDSKQINDLKIAVGMKSKTS